MTPQEALAAALYENQTVKALTIRLGRFNGAWWDRFAREILAAMPDWTLVNDEDFHAELTDDELATCAAMNFGAGLAEGRKESEAEIARLREASGLAVDDAAQAMNREEGFGMFDPAYRVEAFTAAVLAIVEPKP